ncbi:hypothetical protein [Streptomyces sp. NPDC054838]
MAPRPHGVCDYYWDRPVVWLVEEHLVVGGLGDDEDELLPGARVFLLGRDHGGSVLEEVATFADRTATSSPRTACCSGLSELQGCYDSFRRGDDDVESELADTWNSRRGTSLRRRVGRAVVVADSSRLWRS